MTSTNHVTPVSSPKWSHKELFIPLILANTQGGLHDLPKKVESWIPKFSREDGSYGNSHWTKFCDAFQFHQSGQEHPDVFLRLFVSSLTGSARRWIKKIPKEASKPLKILNKSLRKIGVKKKEWIPFTLNILIFARLLARALGISMAGSIFSSKISDLASRKKLSSNTT
jgi:hypothetical protein